MALKKKQCFVFNGIEKIFNGIEKKRLPPTLPFYEPLLGYFQEDNDIRPAAKAVLF